MTIQVIVCTGIHLHDKSPLSGSPRSELIAAFTDHQKALELLESGEAEVSDPVGWGVRAFDVQGVQLEEEPDGQAHS